MQALFSEQRAKFYLMPNEFGDLVAKYRIDRNLSQRELAKRIGKSATYINYVESGKNPTSKSGEFVPPVDVVDKIAKVLGIPKDKARDAAGFKSDPRQPQTVEELVQELYRLGIIEHLEFYDSADNSPEALERVKVSLGAVLQGLLRPRQK